MPISNYFPNSRISQAGVVPNEAARPVSPYTGQVIYQLDTLRTLVWNGTAWVDLSTGQTERSGLALIHSQIFSAVDPLDITNVFSSKYLNYKVLLSHVGSSASYINLQFFSGTNTIFSSSLYDRYGFTYSTAGNLSNLYLATQSQYSLSLHSTTSTQRMPTELTIFQPNTGNRKYIFTESFDTNGAMFVSQCMINTTTVFTGLRLDGNVGTLTGEIQIYGYNQ